MEKVSLALVMMVKNESKRITVSFDSVKKYVDCFVILDTGSEDNTIDIIKNYCQKENIKLYLTEKVFPPPFHFSNARNTVLDYADDKADYLLLLDCNDELKGGEKLRKFINNHNGVSSGFHVCQEWWNGTCLDKYYNIRLVKTKNDWRYKGAIHEFITSPVIEKIGPSSVLRLEGFTIYQDRTKDDDKSQKRFSRDEEILHAEYEEHLKEWAVDKTKLPDTRNLFYYGQTCMCLGKNEKAYTIYKERCKLDGFLEEKYHSYFRCGELSRTLSHSWEIALSWYLKAYEYSSTIFDHPRAEPLFRIAEYYRDKNWEMAFMYLRRCCDLKFPDNAILFIDRRVYDYCRWHLMGIVAFYVKEFNIGKIACKMAIQAENNGIDKENLQKYEEVLKKL